MAYKVSEVQEWIAHDPDEADRAELTALLSKAENQDLHAVAELSDRFQGLLEFGTAGLRGAMAAGPFRMNRAVVRKAAAGLSSWLKEKVGTDALVVIGYDARHHSEDFAYDTAAIVAAAGLRAKIMPRALPTPLLAGAVRYFEADAGVMVTASHNPKWDNGYKVYVGGRAVDHDGTGVQIVPPIDSEIAAAIQATPYADEIPLASSGWHTIGEEYIDWYVHATASFLPDSAPRHLKIVYTPMHGVGANVMLRVLEAAGFHDVVTVAEQLDPDPEFPTVSFPNPEETGALDLAIALATKENADIVIASDPDADRTSAAIPTPDGAWRQLSGDEIGSLLGECVARIAEHATTGCFASSIVSSRLLRKIADAHGMKYTPTLTGFKWIARTPDIIYGYEEAIGFCVNPRIVKDKDGLSGGALLAWLADHLNKAGKTLQNTLDDLAIAHGVHLTAPVTVRVDDLSIIPATMAKLRSCPPRILAGSRVASLVDLQDAPAAMASLGVPPTNALMIHTEADDRVMIRPSGTEPKVKCYLEVIEDVTDPDDLPRAQQEARKRLERFKADVSEALKL